MIAGCSAMQICADELGKLEKVALFKSVDISLISAISVLRMELLFKNADLVTLVAFFVALVG